MNRDRNEEQLSELDRELAQMAQDVPDMPADFHARWTEQIRAASGQAKAESRKENRKQLRYVLSAAAVFVFLIGGTLITRNAGNRGAPDSFAPKDAAVSHEAAALPEEAEEVLFAKTASNALTMEEGAAEVSGNGVGNAVFADTAAGTAVALEEDAEEAPGEPPAALMMAMPTSMPTSVPAAEPGRKEAFAAAPAAEENTADAGAAAIQEEPEKETENGFVSFLKDLGIFTLKTLAAALCGAALACLAAVIHRALKNRKK